MQFQKLVAIWSILSRRSNICAVISTTGLQCTFAEKSDHEEKLWPFKNMAQRQFYSISVCTFLKVVIYLPKCGLSKTNTYSDHKMEGKKPVVHLNSLFKVRECLAEEALPLLLAYVEWIIQNENSCSIMIKLHKSKGRCSIQISAEKSHISYSLFTDSYFVCADVPKLLSHISLWYL